MEWDNFYKNYVEKKKKKLSTPRASRASKVEERWLLNFGSHIKKQYYVKELGFYFDGYDEEKKLALEFHGCFYHGCLICHQDIKEINKKSKKTMGELLLATYYREKKILEAGYHLFRIWEHDYYLWEKRRGAEHPRDLRSRRTMNLEDDNNNKPGKEISMKEVDEEIKKLLEKMGCEAPPRA